MILIAVPYVDTVVPEVFAAIYNQDPFGHESVLRPFGEEYGIDAKRNGIAELALDLGADYVLMVDSDTVIPTHALNRLLEPAGDVVMGYYPLKTDESMTNMVRAGAASYERMTMAELGDSDGRIPAKAGGFGCTMIRAEVLRSIPKPWFSFDHHSEDYRFCRLAIEHGFSVEVDAGVRCRHAVTRFL